MYVIIYIYTGNKNDRKIQLAILKIPYGSSIASNFVCFWPKNNNGTKMMVQWEKMTQYAYIFKEFWFSNFN